MIALIGLPGSGKTYTIKLLKQKGYSVLIADDFFKDQYKKGNVGYSLIKKELGNDFVNNETVIIYKLRDYSIHNMSHIESIVHPILEKHLQTHSYDFVELPIIASKYANFKNLFSLIINITRESTSDAKHTDFNSMIINRQKINKSLDVLDIPSGNIEDIINKLII